MDSKHRDTGIHLLKYITEGKKSRNQDRPAGLGLPGSSSRLGVKYFPSSSTDQKNLPVLQAGCNLFSFFPMSEMGCERGGELGLQCIPVIPAMWKLEEQEDQSQPQLHKEICLKTKGRSEQLKGEDVQKRVECLRSHRKVLEFADQYKTLKLPRAIIERKTQISCACWVLYHRAMVPALSTGFMMSF